MRSEKVNYMIDIINKMNEKDKLRFAISISSSHYNILYDKKDMYEVFDRKLREIDEYYTTTHINMSKYKVVTFAMAKIMEMTEDEQNQVVLYLINIIGINKNEKIAL